MYFRYDNKFSLRIIHPKCRTTPILSHTSDIYDADSVLSRSPEKEEETKTTCIACGKRNRPEGTSGMSGLQDRPPGCVLLIGRKRECRRRGYGPISFSFRYRLLLAIPSSLAAIRLFPEFFAIASMMTRLSAREPASLSFFSPCPAG